MALGTQSASISSETPLSRTSWAKFITTRGRSRLSGSFIGCQRLTFSSSKHVLETQASFPNGWRSPWSMASFPLRICFGSTTCALGWPMASIHSKSTPLLKVRMQTLVWPSKWLRMSRRRRLRKSTPTISLLSNREYMIYLTLSGATSRQMCWKSSQVKSGTLWTGSTAGSANLSGLLEPIIARSVKNASSVWTTTVIGSETASVSTTTSCS